MGGLMTRQMDSKDNHVTHIYVNMYMYISINQYGYLQTVMDTCNPKNAYIPFELAGPLLWVLLSLAVLFGSF